MTAGVLNRRQFLGAAATAALSRADAQSTSEWGGPVLDIHLHPRRQEGGELDHINGSGVTKAVLLTGAAMADHSKALVAKNPARFVWFVGMDMTRPDAIDVLRKDLAAGAIGQFEGEGTWNGGIARFPAVVHANPKTRFGGSRWTEPDFVVAKSAEVGQDRILQADSQSASVRFAAAHKR